MDNLRLILILIGLVVLAAIWLLHRPEGSSRKPGASRREERRREPFIGEDDGAGQDEPDIEAGPDTPRQTTLPELDAAGEEDADDPQAGEGRRDGVAPPSGSGAGADPAASEVPHEREWLDADPMQKPSDARAPGVSSGDEGLPKIVTLYVRARGDRRISGLSLLDAAIKAGLRFGEMKIFHRRHRGATKPVFSMANITRPGSFDPSGWNLFQTPGVTLFMTLPGPVSALDAWDAMLATGKRLAELLDAELMDDTQCLITRQRIAQIREDMREFDRIHGLEKHS